MNYKETELSFVQRRLRHAQHIRCLFTALTRQIPAVVLHTHTHIHTITRRVNCNKILSVLITILLYTLTSGTKREVQCKALKLTEMKISVDFRFSSETQ